MTNKTYQNFLDNLGLRESGGDGGYLAENTLHYIGKYQMSEGALEDAGYYTSVGDITPGVNDWVGTWTGKDGIFSKSDYLNSSTAQENSIRAYQKATWSYIAEAGLDKYAGKVINGITITESSLLAGYHLVGLGYGTNLGLKDFLQSNGSVDPVDPYGTPISEYLLLFGGYYVPAEIKEISFNVIAGDSENNIIVSTASDDILKGLGGHDNFIFDLNSGHDTITDFGGVSNFWDYGFDVPEHDTLRFSGAGLTADKMLLTYDGDNSFITFEGVPNLSVTLENFDFINLDNLPNGLHNILFNGQSESYNYSLIDNYSNSDQTLDSIDVVNDHTTNLAQVWNANTVTFLNEIDNVTNGLDNSADVINGMGGNDTIFGKSGNDILRGQEGNDILNGGIGADILSGGEGNDIFVYSNPIDSTATSFDLITDFVSGTDKIDLSALNLDFAGLNINFDGANTIVENAASGLMIELQGNVNLVQNDFIFN